MDETIGKFIDCSKSEWTPEWKSPEPKDHVINTIADTPVCSPTLACQSIAVLSGYYCLTH